MRKHPVFFLFFVLLFLSAGPACCGEMAISQEDLDYRKFKLDNETCDVAVLYRDTKDGADVAISAIAMGKGANFRKWLVTDVRLRSGEDRIRPDDYGKFYVRQESFFRLPAAVLFAALGTQINVSGSSLNQGIGKAGAAIGLGLLAWAAKGDIEGYKCLFRLNKDIADRIKAGRVFAEIKVENQDEHLQDTIKIGIAKQASRADNKAKYEKMGQDELAKLIAHLGWRAKTLEEEQSSYKYGVDPKYDEIQSRIEDIETQRAVAHEIWFEKLEKK